MDVMTTELTAAELTAFGEGGNLDRWKAAMQTRPDQRTSPSTHEGKKNKETETNTTKPKKRNPGGHNGLPASTEPRQTQPGQPPPCLTIYLPTNPHMGSWLASSLHAQRQGIPSGSTHESQMRAA